MKNFKLELPAVVEGSLTVSQDNYYELAKTNGIKKSTLESVSAFNDALFTEVLKNINTANKNDDPSDHIHSGSVEGIDFKWGYDIDDVKTATTSFNHTYSENYQKTWDEVCSVQDTLSNTVDTAEDSASTTN